jgi:hypothetical protein
MNDPDDIEALERNLPPRITEMPRPRAVGSPLPMGSGSRAPEPIMEGDAPRITPVAGPIAEQDQLPEEEDDLADQPSNLQRAVKGMRMALPFVQKVLPLLDGQILTAISNVLAPRAPAPPPPVNLGPLQDNLAILQTQHRELCDQIADQNTSLKRVEDRLEMVREATDRNTLEQQEFLEDLKKVNRKSTIIAAVAATLLAVSIAGNVLLYLHIRGILHW